MQQLFDFEQAEHESGGGTGLPSSQLICAQIEKVALPLSNPSDMTDSVVRRGGSRGGTPAPTVVVERASAQLLLLSRPPRPASLIATKRPFRAATGSNGHPDERSKAKIEHVVESRFRLLLVFRH